MKAKVTNLSRTDGQSRVDYGLTKTLVKPLDRDKQFMEDRTIDNDPKHRKGECVRERERESNREREELVCIGVQLPVDLFYLIFLNLLNLLLFIFDKDTCPRNFLR